MREQAGRGTYLTIVLLAGLLAGSLSSTYVYYACKFFCDSFVVGYSAAKTLLFLGWLLLLMILRLVPLPSRSWMEGGCIGLLGCSYLMTLVEYFWYCAQVGIEPWTRWSAPAVNGSYSFNTPGHLHVSKGLTSSLLYFSNGGDKVDVGYPFLPLFPSWWTFLHLILFTGALVLSLPLIRERSFRLGAGSFFCFAASFYCLFKCAIDGGPFSQPFLLGVAPVLYYLWGKRPALLAAPWLLLGLILRFAWEEGIADYEILHGLAICAVLFTPPATEYLWIRRPRAAALCGLAGLSYLMVSPFLEYHYIPWTRWQPRAVARYFYGTHTLPKGIEFSLVTHRELQPHPKYTSVEVFQGRRLRLHRLKALEETSPLEVCESADLGLARLPLVIHPRRTYWQVRGVLFDEWPSNWPDSDLVIDYRWKTEGREITLELEMRPGSNLTALLDSLPPGLMLLLEPPRWSLETDSSDSWLDSGSPLPLPRGHLNR